MLKERMDFPGATSPEEIEDILRTNCDGVRNDFEYNKILSVTELDERREKKVNLDIEVSKLQKEKKDYIAQMKATIDPLADQSAELMEVVKNGFEEITDTVFFFKDFDSGMIGYYDNTGYLVSQRRMTPEEKQSTIFSDTKISK